MTDDPHDLTSVAAILRAPALPSEQEGEAAAVSVLIETHANAVGSVRAPRSRRVLTIAAVTVASLGVGGLVAAGPKIFGPSTPDEPSTAAMPNVGDRLPPSAIGAGTTVALSGADGPSATAAATAGSESNEPAGPIMLDDADGDESAPPGATDETIGNCLSDAISDILAAIPPGPERGELLPGLIDDAIAGCDDDTEAPSSPADDEAAAPGNSATAPGQTGQTPGHTGNTPAPPAEPGPATPPGQSDAPPGQSGDTPGQSGDTPGQSGDTPGQSGDTPGQSGDTPGQSGDTPGQSGETPEPPAPPDQANGGKGSNGNSGG